MTLQTLVNVMILVLISVTIFVQIDLAVRGRRRDREYAEWRRQMDQRIEQQMQRDEQRKPNGDKSS